MQICNSCGGRAIPGLAHLHGNPSKPLCHPCTEKVVKSIKKQLEQKVEKKVKKAA